MLRMFGVVVLAAVMGGCALHAGTSGRVVFDDGPNRVDVSFSQRDRALIERYYASRPKPKKTPPGLAKREQLPPGLAKRDRLPPGLRGRGLPEDLERQLSPLPPPYVRVVVGSDVVLMDRHTRVIVDIVRGLPI